MALMSALEAQPESTGMAAVADGFGDQAWFEAWYDAFAPAAKRYRVALSETELQPEFFAGSTRILRWSFPFLQSPVNSHTPRYGWQLSQHPTLTEVSRQLLDVLQASRCHGIELRVLPEDGATSRLVNDLATTGRWVASVEEAELASLVDTAGPWDSYRRALSANLTRTLNWKENKLRRLGRFSFSDVAQDVGLTEWLEQALELEARGWKGREHSAIIQRPNETSFYRRVVEASAAEGRLRLFVATLDGRLVAFQLMIAERSILFLLKLAYDETLSSYSPGTVLQRLIMNNCFTDPSIRAVDLGGPGEWKRRWTTRTERLLRVRLVPATSLAGFLLRAELQARRLQARLNR
jgi:CelD/BcsL family acetyltransferase involved in cellulose biosynthesis